MTDNDINIAIAEACGWKWRRATWKDRLYYVEPVKFITTRPDGVEFGGYLPRYCNDLNAMQEAVMSLSNTKFHKWAQELSILLTGTKHKAPTRDFLCATARQRAEAFLKTLNLWKE